MLLLGSAEMLLLMTSLVVLGPTRMGAATAAEEEEMHCQLQHFKVSNHSEISFFEVFTSPKHFVSECKVWRNPLNLLRGAEYNRYHWVTGRDALTYYDMNLSAQDHQNYFTCDSDISGNGRPGDKLMYNAWREVSQDVRIKMAQDALKEQPELL